MFRPKNSRIIAWELKREWEHLFQSFSTDLDERLASAGYKKDQEKKQNKTAEQTDNISSRGFRHENENTA